MSEIRLDANAQAAVAEILKVVDAALKVDQAGAKLLQTSKDQAAEERRLAQSRARFFKEFETQSDRAKRRIEEFERAVKDQAVEEKNVANIRTRLHAQHAAALERERAAVDRVGEATENVGDKTDGAFGAGALKKLGAFAAGALSIQAGIGLVKKELDAVQDVIDKSVARQISVDQSRAVVRRNLGGASNEDIKRVQDAATFIADETGVSETFINQGIAEAISASGGNIASSIKAVSDAAKFAADSPTDIGMIAGALLDLAKATGTDDARTNLGYLSAIGVQGRVADVKQQAANLAPGVIGTLAYGGNYRESGAALAAISNASADASGAPSGTAVIQLANQLKAFDEAVDSFDGASIGGRIAALQQDQKLAQQFLADASFEGKSAGVIRQLLTDQTSVAAREYQNSLKAIPGIDGLRERGDRSIEVLDVENTAALTARRERAIARATEKVLTAETEDSLSSTEIENVKAQLQKVGKAYRTEADLTLFTQTLDFDGVSGDEAAKTIRDRGTQMMASTFVANPYGGTGIYLPPAESRAQGGQALIDIATRLEAILAESKNQIKETKKQTEVIKKKPGTATR